MFPVMFLSGMVIAPPTIDPTTVAPTTVTPTTNIRLDQLRLETVASEPNGIATQAEQQSAFKTAAASMVRPETGGPEFSSSLSSRPTSTDAIRPHQPMLMAQVRPNNDGVNTRVTPQGNEFVINGGTQGENNLFHSFQSFALTAEQIAIFQTLPTIENVLGRINGGDVSVINGEIRLTGSDANLFLINPAGMIFGDNATLNVPASFTATTANGIGFGPDDWFSVVGDNAYEQLTDGPTRFGFTSAQPGSIINTGDLAVESGYVLSLVGGSVYSSGRLSAPNGQVLIQTVPESGIVQIKPEGNVLTLELQPLPEETDDLPNAPDSNASENTPSDNSPQSLAELLTGGTVDQATGITVDPDGTIHLNHTPLANGDLVAHQIEAGTTTLSAEGNLYAGNITTYTPGGGGSIILEALGNIAIASPDGSPVSLLSNGGDMVFYSREGDIDMANSTLHSEFDSSTQGLFAEGVKTDRGGNIDMYSRGNITTGSLFSQGGYIAITSTGHVTITANPLTQFRNFFPPDTQYPPQVNFLGGGQITVQGEIDTQTGTAQRGGNVAIQGIGAVTAQNITTGGADLSVISGTTLDIPEHLKDDCSACDSPALGSSIDTRDGTLDTTHPTGNSGGDVLVHGYGNVQTGAIAAGGETVKVVSSNGSITVGEIRMVNPSIGPDAPPEAQPVDDDLRGVILQANTAVNTRDLISNGHAINLSAGTTIDTTAGTLDSSRDGEFNSSTINGGTITLGADLNLVIGDLLSDGADISLTSVSGDIQPEGIFDARIKDPVSSDNAPVAATNTDGTALGTSPAGTNNRQAGRVTFKGPNLETFYETVQDQVPGGIEAEDITDTNGTGPSFGDAPAPPTAPLSPPDIQTAQLPNINDLDVDEPDVNEPDVDEPNIDEPDVDEPNIDEPDVDEPDIDEPDVDEPDVDEPDVNEPDIDEPDIDELDVNEPDIDEPEIDEPDVNEPDIDEPEIDEPDIDEPDVDKPEIDEPDIQDPSDLERSQHSEQSQENSEEKACTEESIACLEENLAIARQNQSTDDEQSLLQQLGWHYYEQGDYIQSMAYYQERLALISSQNISSQDISSQTLSLIQPQALADLAGVYGTIGDYERAIAYYQQGLEAVRSLGNHTVAGVTVESDILNRLGMVHYAKRDYTQAVAFQQKSLLIVRQLDDPARMGNRLSQLGLAYYANANYGEAIALQQQSLILAQQTGDSTAEGMALENLGLAHYALTDFVQAVDYHQQSLAIAKEGGDRHAEGRALTNLGDAQYQLGNVDGAVASLSAAIDIWESLRENLTDHDLHRVSIFETHETTYSTLQAVLAESNQSGKALEITERGRARAFVELLNQNRHPSESSESSAATPAAGHRGLLQIDPNLMASTSVEPALSAAAPASDSGGDTAAPTLDRIRQIAREQNATLVSYSVIKEADDRTGQRQTHPTELYIWVVQPDGSTEFRRQSLEVLYQAGTTLADEVELARCDNPRCRWSNETPIEGSSRLLNHSLHQLHQLLIEPIADRLPTEAEATVVIIPDDELFLVPFAALQDTSGRYLVETHTLRTAPSIQVLDLTHQQTYRSRSYQSSGMPLIVGNPTMPELPPMVSSVGGVLPSLPGAEQEALTIAELLGAKALVGDRATEEAVVEAITQAPIVHLATHGLLHDVDVSGMPGAIALAPGDTSDGLLTAREIIDLDLMADLVVLSACDTGRGRITSDGVIGLSRSLMSSGVPSVMVSLWQVPDDATQELMTRFYHHLQHMPDKTQALRQAMLDTMVDHPDPMNWSAFTLMGQG